jgi:hypothetical protein
VPAHLHRELGVAAPWSWRGGALAVGVVDHPHRQPQHAPLDLVERGEVDRPVGIDDTVGRAVGNTVHAASLVHRAPGRRRADVMAGVARSVVDDDRGAVTSASPTVATRPLDAPSRVH